MQSPTSHDDAPPANWRIVLSSWLEGSDPRPVRGPLARWPRATDGLIALVVLTGSLVTVALSQLADGQDLTVASMLDQSIGALLLLTAAALSLLWRRARPVAVTAVVATLSIAWAIAGYGDGNDLALAVAIYSVGRYESDQRTSLLAVACVIGTSVLVTVIDSSQRIDVAPALLLALLPWYAGRRMRNRGEYLKLLQDRAEWVEAEQHARAQQAVAEERSRIARELHDVVAHQVSMMTIQAGAARTVARSDPDAAIEAMGDVESAGRQALGELRHLLGVLRPGDGGRDDLGPQPGITDIPSLAEPLNQIGATVSLTIGRLPANLPTALDLSAYRIVQESITNIVKHAGPNPTVEITIAAEEQALAVNVTNTTSGLTQELPSSGFGILGMQERARQLGGTLVAGHHPPNRFTVEARLPLEPEPA